jgi:fumarylacetoacetate (FAA) hydrolase
MNKFRQILLSNQLFFQIKMKLATLNDGTRDGKLIIVSRDNLTYVDASDIASCLQLALDNWKDVESKLLSRAKDLEDKKIEGKEVDISKIHSPLPRAYEWIDGSAYVKLKNFNFFKRLIMLF